MAKNEGTVKVRRARPSDVAQLARLAGQLGYPTTVPEMTARLREVLRANDGACFVAETREEGVVGWIHVTVAELLEVDRRAEVNGLVVDESVRSHGAGWGLLNAAEAWAKKKKCTGMSVRSNVKRERAHGFYLRHGYEHYKTQKAFRKKI